MAFNFKSIGDIANAISTTKDLVSGTSDLVSSFKTNSKKDSKKETKKEAEKETTQEASEQMYPEKIEKLIKFILADGEINDEEIEMLERAATKEGLDPDEVVFVTKKRLKRLSKKEQTTQTTNPSLSLTPAKRLAYELREIDNKFDSAIENIMNGDSSGFSAILDTLTGGISGIAVSIGKKLFCESDEDKINKLESARYDQRTNVINATTVPDNLPHIIELLEYVFRQTKESDEEAWDTLHITTYNRALLMASDDEKTKLYLESFIPESLKPKKKRKFGKRVKMAYWEEDKKNGNLQR